MSAAAGRSWYLLEVRKRSRDRFDNLGPRWGERDGARRTWPGGRGPPWVRDSSRDGVSRSGRGAGFDGPFGTLGHIFGVDLVGEGMRPEFGIHMMIRASSEEELLKEEVSLLQAKIACLQQLIAELLLKNQQLREALGDRKTEYTSSVSCGGLLVRCSLDRYCFNRLIWRAGHYQFPCLPPYHQTRPIVAVS